MTNGAPDRVAIPRHPAPRVGARKLEGAKRSPGAHYNHTVLVQQGRGTSTAKQASINLSDLDQHYRGNAWGLPTPGMDLRTSDKTTSACRSNIAAKVVETAAPGAQQDRGSRWHKRPTARRSSKRGSKLPAGGRHGGDGYTGTRRRQSLSAWWDVADNVFSIGRLGHFRPGTDFYKTITVDRRLTYWALDNAIQNKLLESFRALW